MKIRFIIIVLVSNLAADQLFFGLFGNDLKQQIINDYKTSYTLGYNNARDIMYSEIDIKPGNQLTGVYSGYTITLDLSQDPIKADSISLEILPDNVRWGEPGRVAKFNFVMSY